MAGKLATAPMKNIPIESIGINRDKSGQARHEDAKHYKNRKNSNLFLRVK